jgi:hypothetical protein
LAAAIAVGGCTSAAGQNLSNAGMSVISGRLVATGGIRSTTGRSAAIPNSQVILSDASGVRVVASTISDPDGYFKFAVAPGIYLVRGAGDQQLVRVEPDKRIEIILTRSFP